MVISNGSIPLQTMDMKSFAPEFLKRFKKFKASDTISVLYDTVTGVEYMLLKPSKYDVGNTTVTSTPLLDSSGFPLKQESTDEKRNYTKRFHVFRVDPTTDVLVDTLTGVQYLIVKPTEFETGNSTISVNPLIADNGFPYRDERFLKDEE